MGPSWAQYGSKAMGYADGAHGIRAWGADLVGLLGGSWGFLGAKIDLGNEVCSGMAAEADPL